MTQESLFKRPMKEILIEILLRLDALEKDVARFQSDFKVHKDKVWSRLDKLQSFMDKNYDLPELKQLIKGNKDAILATQKIREGKKESFSTSFKIWQLLISIVTVASLIIGIVKSA